MGCWRGEKTGLECNPRIVSGCYTLIVPYHKR